VGRQSRASLVPTCTQMVLPRQGGGDTEITDRPPPVLGPLDGPEAHDPFCTNKGHKHSKRLTPLSPLPGPVGAFPDGAPVKFYTVPAVGAYREIGFKGTAFGPTTGPNGLDRFTQHRQRCIPLETRFSSFATAPYSKGSQMIPMVDTDKYKCHFKRSTSHTRMIPPSHGFGPFRYTEPAWKERDLVTPVTCHSIRPRASDSRGSSGQLSVRARTADSPPSERLFSSPTKSRLQLLRTTSVQAELFASSASLRLRSARGSASAASLQASLASAASL